MNYKLIAETIKIERLITQVYPVGIVSLVSDTFNYWDVITKIVPFLKEKIQGRMPILDENGEVLVPGRTVFRPDSGDPVKIVTGYLPNEYHTLDGEYICNETGNVLPEHVVKGSVEVLWDIFGGTVSPKGYRTIDSCVGLIYGDSITLQRADQILERLEQKGFAANNIVFGVGSFTYQYNTRDTFGFAMKATWGQVGGEGRPIFKDPVTDNGTKKSAKGLLRVEQEGDDFVLCDEQETDDGGVLEVIFENGTPYNVPTFDQIKARLHGEGV